MSMRCWAGPSGALLAVALTSATARAGGDESPFRVDYQAPLGCPSPPEFAARVAARSEHARLAVGPVLARTMHVSVELAADRALGKLVFLDRDGVRVERDVSASDCAGAVDALVLITALALDAQLGETPSEAAVEVLPPYFVGTHSAEAPATLLTDRRPRDAADGLATGLDARLRTAAVPHVGHGLGVWVDPWSSLGVGAAWVTAGTVEENGRRARFDTLWGELTGCSGGLVLGQSRLLACARIELGAVRGAGRRTAGVSSVRTEYRAWSALSVLGRWETRLHERAVLRFQLGPTLPFTRPRFRFEDPEIVVFRPPGVGLGAGLGIGLRLP
jgi:hypothetical protein